VGKLNLEKVNLVDILKHYRIDYQEFGRNIGTDCIGVCCPFCKENNYHLGIFKEGGNFSCWKCKYSGSLYELLRELIKVPYYDFVITIKRLEATRKAPEYEKKQEEKKYPKLPDFCVEAEKCHIFPVFQKFIKKRKLNMDTLIERNVHFCYAGKYTHRMILPIYHHYQLIGFQARDLTGWGKKKYDNPEHFPITNYFYNFDRAKYFRSIIIVEGIFDCWRIAELDGVVASFTSNLSTQQQLLLVEEIKPKEVIIAWDFDAYRTALKIGKKIASLFKTKVLILPEDRDPDLLGIEPIKQLIKETDYL